MSINERTWYSLALTVPLIMGWFVLFDQELLLTYLYPDCIPSFSLLATVSFVWVAYQLFMRFRLRATLSSSDANKGD